MLLWTAAAVQVLASPGGLAKGLACLLLLIGTTTAALCRIR